MEIEGLPLQPDLSYIEHPVKILGEKERVTRNNVVKFYKVQCQKHSEVKFGGKKSQTNYMEYIISI